MTEITDLLQGMNGVVTTIITLSVTIIAFGIGSRLVKRFVK